MYSVDSNWSLKNDCIIAKHLISEIKSDLAQNAEEIIKTNQRIIIQITYTSSDHDKNTIQFKKTV